MLNKAQGLRVLELGFLPIAKAGLKTENQRKQTHASVPQVSGTAMAKLKGRVVHFYLLLKIGRRREPNILSACVIYLSVFD